MGRQALGHIHERIFSAGKCMGVLKCVKKKIRYRLCERASSRFGDIVRGLLRDKELVGRRLQ